jgi:hypothetical protein
MSGVPSYPLPRPQTLCVRSPPHAAIITHVVAQTLQKNPLQSPLKNRDHMDHSSLEVSRPPRFPLSHGHYPRIPGHHPRIPQLLLSTKTLLDTMVAEQACTQCSLAWNAAQSSAHKKRSARPVANLDAISLSVEDANRCGALENVDWLEEKGTYALAQNEFMTS